MSYNLPGVELTQVAVLPNANLQDAELYATIVAPLYRIVKSVSALKNTVFPSGGVTPANKITINYPKVDPGSIIDLTSLKVNIVNGIIEWSTIATGSFGFVAGETVFEDLNTDFIALGVKGGDKVVVGDYNSSNGEYVIKKVNQHSLEFTYQIYKTILVTDIGYKITRSIDSWLLASSSYIATQSNIVISSIANGAKNFLSGEITLSYRALRKDKKGLVKYDSLDTVLSDMEVDDINNKLGYYIKNAVMPANGNSVSFLVYFLDEDTDTAYISALSELINFPNIYMLVPLSNSDTVKNAYASHVTVASQPEESSFRVLFTSTDLVVKRSLATGSVTK